ncbi:hypothetical protein Sste5346_008025 [Sporothrix stenoceras]|uniref:Uncharacterized protein n=1 Tax=Sporothrix stenoceras TaxID=5173 RepID=A0ABR3YU79_9PEZI
MFPPLLSQVLAAVGVLLVAVYDPCDPSLRLTKGIATEASLAAAIVYGSCNLVVYYQRGGPNVVDARVVGVCQPLGMIAGAVAGGATRLFLGQAILRQVPRHCACDGEKDGRCKTESEVAKKESARPGMASSNNKGENMDPR